MLCRRAKEQKIGRSTPLHAHDDQITLSFRGDPENFAPGLPCVINESMVQNSGAVATASEDAGAEPPRVSSGSRRGACAFVVDVGVVLEFVRHGVEDGEPPVGFLRHRHRIFQRV